MKVKVGNTVFDGEHEPVMVVLNDLDKQNIANMADDAARYASYPKGSDTDEISAWMADASYWHDAPYAQIAELRVAEGQIKALRVVVQTLRREALQAAGLIHPDQKCPCVLMLRYCTGDPCDNCNC